MWIPTYLSYYHKYIGCYGCSVSQSCLTLCNPMDCSIPGFPVFYHFPEPAQTHVHWISDAIQSSYPLSSPSPAFHLSQHQGLDNHIHQCYMESIILVLFKNKYSIINFFLGLIVLKLLFKIVFKSLLSSLMFLSAHIFFLGFIFKYVSSTGASLQGYFCMGQCSHYGNLHYHSQTSHVIKLQ